MPVACMPLQPQSARLLQHVTLFGAHFGHVYQEQQARCMPYTKTFLRTPCPGSVVEHLLLPTAFSIPTSVPDDDAAVTQAVHGTASSKCINS